VVEYLCRLPPPSTFLSVNFETSYSLFSLVFCFSFTAWILRFGERFRSVVNRDFEQEDSEVTEILFPECPANDPAV
jgi:hypothetical protein